MRIQENDESKTAFQIGYSHFEYHVILFGHSNANVSIKNYVNKILVKKSDVFVIIYLNNIIINTQNMSHNHIKVIFEFFKNFGNITCLLI